MRNRKFLELSIEILRKIELEHPELEASVINELNIVIRQIETYLNKKGKIDYELASNILALIGRFISIIPSINNLIHKL